MEGIYKQKRAGSVRTFLAPPVWGARQAEKTGTPSIFSHLFLSLEHCRCRPFSFVRASQSGPFWGVAVAPLTPFVRHFQAWLFLSVPIMVPI